MGFSITITTFQKMIQYCYKLTFLKLQFQLDIVKYKVL